MKSKTKFRNSGITRKQLEGASVGSLLLMLVLILAVYFLIYTALVAVLPVLFGIFGVILTVGQAKAIVLTVLMIKLLFS